MTISRLALVRHEQRALRDGNYRQLQVASEQMAFLRHFEDEYVLVVVNSATSIVELDLPLAAPQSSTLVDLLDHQEHAVVRVPVPPCGVRLLKGAAFK